MTLTIEGLTEEDVRFAQQIEAEGVQLAPLVSNLLDSLKNGKRGETTAEKTHREDEEANERLRAFREWMAMPRRSVEPLLDDSRAAIYGEEPDRG